jgi:hypothetical protein
MEETVLDLEIILRTCDRAENNPELQRIIQVPRRFLINRCLTSLIRSINHISNQHKIRLTVIDDSTSDFNSHVKRLVDQCIFESQLIYRPGMTNNECMAFCYDHALKTPVQVLYFVEDDYFHFKSCLPEMISAYETFKRNLGNLSVAIHPADSPLEYRPGYIFPSRIVLGEFRHWRTTVSSSFTLMISRHSFIKHYKKFEDYAKFDGVNYHEANTINLMFVDDVHLFSPIPTLAIHVGYLDPPAPFISLKDFWKDQGETDYV